MTGSRARAFLGLLLLLPVPTLGVAAGMVWLPGTIEGRLAFFAAKAWTLALPLCWDWREAAARRWLAPPTRAGWLAGAATGLAVGAAVAVAYAAGARQLMDADVFRASMRQVGLASKPAFLAGAAYWVFVNALLEEYVWRWFVTGQMARLVRPGAAVALSAIAFSAHHVVAMGLYLPVAALCAASAGVAAGGLLWSWCFVRYRTVWPGWLSHVVADVAVFAVGYRMLFGGG